MYVQTSRFGILNDSQSCAVLHATPRVLEFRLAIDVAAGLFRQFLETDLLVVTR